MLYAVPNNSTMQRLVRSDVGTPSYMRAPGEAPGTFALEVAMGRRSQIPAMVWGLGVVFIAYAVVTAQIM